MKFKWHGRLGIEPTSPPVWGAWIEILLRRLISASSLSPPVWGAWIEISNCRFVGYRVSVAPRVGGVD